MTSMRARLAVSAALAASLVISVVPVHASSHREAPFITRMPKVDNTDVYAFRSYEPGREQFVTILANFYPLQDPFGGPIYFPMDPDAQYEIHVDSDGDAREDFTFSFDFNQTLINNRGIVLNVGGQDNSIPLRQIGQVTEPADPQLGYREDYGLTLITGDRRTGTRAAVTNASNNATRFEKPFDNAGLKTTPDYPAYARQFVNNIRIPGCGTAGRVFVGQREDPFAVNLGETFDLVNYVPIQGGGSNGFPGGIDQKERNDDVQGTKNVTTLAIEVPIACLTGRGNGVIGVWSSASLPQNRSLSTSPTFQAPDTNTGPLVQVSRLGMPLVNELVIGMDSKDRFNSAHPTQDGMFAQFVTNPTFPAILDALFRAPVNQTLGTNIANLAPQVFPRRDLVATFLTGIPSLNQQATVTPSEMLRLNTRVSPRARDTQNNLGVVGDDLAGFPNGRRPGDDVVDIVLRVAMGRLCHPIPIAGRQTSLGYCNPDQAPVGTVPFTDGAPVNARYFFNAFPYINNAIPGSPDEVREARAISSTPQ